VGQTERRRRGQSEERRPVGISLEGQLRAEKGPKGGKEKRKGTGKNALAFTSKKKSAEVWSGLGKKNSEGDSPGCQKLPLGDIGGKGGGVFSRWGSDSAGYNKEFNKNRTWLRGGRRGFCGTGNLTIMSRLLGGKRGGN